MIYKTRGIVLRTINYSDTSIITKIYTEQFGLQSYLVKGAKRKKSAVKANLFQPLYLLELVVYKKEKKQLQTIKEAKPEVFSSVYSNPVKASVLYFLDELLIKCLREEERNPELFSFLHQSLEFFYSLKNGFVNFHLIFLLRFSRFLGFFPQGSFSESTQVFDLREGKFVSTEPLHGDFIGREGCRLLNKLIAINYYSIEKLILSGKERSYLLNTLLQYYQLHLSGIGSFSSQKVLKQVLA